MTTTKCPFHTATTIVASVLNGSVTKQDVIAHQHHNHHNHAAMFGDGNGSDDDMMMVNQ